MLMEAFPNASKIVTNFTDAMRAGQGAATGLLGSLKGLGGVIVAHPWITLTAAITGTVMAIDWLSKSAERAAEKAREQAAASKEAADACATEESQLKDLIDRYEKIASSGDINADDRKELRNIQKEINGLVDGEVHGLDLVNGRLSDQLDILRQISKEQIDKNLSTYTVAYSDAAKASEAGSRGIYSDFTLGWAQKFEGKDLYIAHGQLLDSEQKIRNLMDGINGISVAFDGAVTEIDLDAQNSKQKYDLLVRAIERIEQISDNPAGSEIYKALVKVRDQVFDEYVEPQQELANVLIDIAARETLDADHTQVDTIDKLNKLRDDLAERIRSDMRLRDVVGDGFADYDTVTSYIDDYLADKFPNLYADGGSAGSGRYLTPLAQSLNKLLNAEDFKDTRDELKSLAFYGELTADVIEDLATENEGLAGILKASGVNARFLAHVLQEELSGRDGLSLLTSRARMLNEALDGMAGKFDEVADAKSDFDKAMEAGEKDDDFKSLADAFKTLNDEFVEGTTNSNAFWAAAEYLFGTDQLESWGWEEGIDRIYEAMKGCVGVFEDAESAGSGFLDKLYELSENGQVLDSDGSLLASISKLSDGSWDFDVDGKHLDELADKMDMSREAVLGCLEALSMFGDVRYYDMDEVVHALFPVDFNGGSVVRTDRVTEDLKDLGYTAKDIRGIIETLNEEAPDLLFFDIGDSVESLTDEFIKLGIAVRDGDLTKINTESLGNLIAQLGYSSEDAADLFTRLSDSVSFADAAGNVQTLEQALSGLESIDFTQTVTGSLDGITDSAGAANDAVNDLQESIDNLHGKDVEINLVTRGTSRGGSSTPRTNTYLSPDSSGWDKRYGAFAKGTFNAKKGAALTGEEGEELVQSGDHAYFVGSRGPEIVNLKDGDIVYNAEETRRIKRGGRFRGVIPSFRAGTGGRSLTSFAAIDGGGGGTNINAGGGMNITANNVEVTVNGAAVGNLNTGKGSDKGYDNLLPDSTSSGGNKEPEKPKVIDWIEIAIDRITSAVDRLKEIAESTYKTLKTRLGATYDEIAKVNDEIALQQKAYDRYMKEASNVGLSSNLAEKVRSGAIDIGEYDSDTAELISEYQEWYEKAIECSDAIQSLREDIASLYKDNFDNIQRDFENQLSAIEHIYNVYESKLSDFNALDLKSFIDLQNTQRQTIALLEKELAGLNKSFSEAMDSGTISEGSEAWYEMQSEIDGATEALIEANAQLSQLYQDKFESIVSNYENRLSGLEHLTNTFNNGLDNLEERGYFASGNYYAALREVESQNVELLKQELKDLTKAMADAVNSGAIEEESEAWYSFRDNINSVKESIQESETAIVELSNAIRELDWERFDYLQNQINNIADEAEFLIDLMDNADLYTDNGQLTDAGMSVMGLHGQDYNIYMAQADKYAEEIKRLNDEIANDPNNTKLLERREELLQAQRDSILAAEDEKQAIVDMVREGIEIELDALQDLITSYTDALDSAKDIYDYQKQIKDQTSEIARLQKQMFAYSGDNSEEARATKQKIQVELAKAQESLEETEYERYISDQKKLLDELYNEYETVLNQRLDNVDVLIADMIEQINTNASVIGDTITVESDKVGYTISEGIQDIWSGSDGIYSVLTTYGDAFTSSLTTVNEVLETIAANVAEMAAHSTELANEEISGTPIDPAALQSESSGGGSSSGGTSSSPPSSSPSKGSPSSGSSSDGKSSLTDKDYYGVALAIWNGRYGWGVGKERRDKLKAKGFDSKKAQSIIDQLGRDGYVFSNAWVGKYYGISDLSPYHYNKYLNGGLVKYTGLAQLDGSPSKPEAVLNAKDTQNFIALKDAMRSIADREGSLPSLFGEGEAAAFALKHISEIALPSVGRSVNIGEVSYEVNIPIEHVEDYEDFMNQMRSDPRFEQLIQSMTVDRLVGGTKIAKNKYRW